MADLSRDLFGVFRETGGDRTPARRQLTFDLPNAGGAVTAPVQAPIWIEGVCKAMSEDTNGLLSAALVGQRWGRYLRRRFSGPGGRKDAARLLDRDMRTINAWFDGQAPYLHAALDVAQRLRDPLLLFVLAGLEPPGETAIAADLERMRADLDQLNRRIAQSRGAP